MSVERTFWVSGFVVFGMVLFVLLAMVFLRFFIVFAMTFLQRSSKKLGGTRQGVPRDCLVGFPMVLRFSCRLERKKSLERKGWFPVVFLSCFYGLPMNFPFPLLL